MTAYLSEKRPRDLSEAFFLVVRLPIISTAIDSCFLPKTLCGFPSPFADTFSPSEVPIYYTAY